MQIFVYRDMKGSKQLVGTLSRINGIGAERFEYSEDFLSNASIDALGISERLPLSKTHYERGEISAFFQGLLPEGEVLGHIAQAEQSPRNDWFSLIAALGCESIGALTFSMEELPQNGFTGTYKPVSPDVAFNLRKSPSKTAAIIASTTRLSLAGAQSKVAWTLPEGLSPKDASLQDWLEPHGGAASTHIIKISRNGEEDLARNELACSLLAKSCGIKTASVFEMLQIPGAIAVERYDRSWIDSPNGRMVARWHQEDFCQALGWIPDYKYQPESLECDYIEIAGDLIDNISRFPSLDRLEFAKRLVFSYAIGNSDAHLKNSSFLYDENWTSRSLAPLYDVTCIPLSGYSTKMPFDVGEHREIEEIDERDIFKICISADVSPGSFDKAVADVYHGLTEPNIPELNEDTERMMARILDNSRSRLTVLQRYLDSI